MTEAAGRERRPKRARGERPGPEPSARRRTEGSKEPGGEPVEPPAGEGGASAAASELRLARRIATFAPLFTLGVAGGVGALVSIGPALLVLAGGALFGTIAFFWASLRTLGGEAPLAEGFDLMFTRKVESPDGAAERKRTALRALKDLELEHSIGKIDDHDFAELSAGYRAEAKAILREMDRDVGPLRERAEQIARSYLAKRGVVDAGVDPDPTATPESDVEDGAEGVPPRASARRQTCLACKASNEIDAVFCKGCGGRLAPRDCPACATVNEPDAAFCKKCGKAVSGAPEEKADASA